MNFLEPLRLADLNSSRGSSNWHSETEAPPTAVVPLSKGGVGRLGGFTAVSSKVNSVHGGSISPYYDCRSCMIGRQGFAGQYYIF
jgi:hypothetical protein